MTWLGALWHLAGLLVQIGPAGLLVTTAVVTAVVLGAMAARRPLRLATGGRPHTTARVLSEQAERTGTPRHRDPDGSGRPRPRAPAAASAAA